MRYSCLALFFVLSLFATLEQVEAGYPEWISAMTQSSFAINLERDSILEGLRHAEHHSYTTQHRSPQGLFESLLHRAIETSSSELVQFILESKPEYSTGFAFHHSLVRLTSMRPSDSDYGQASDVAALLMERADPNLAWSNWPEKKEYTPTSYLASQLEKGNPQVRQFLRALLHKDGKLGPYLPLIDEDLFSDLPLLDQVRLYYSKFLNFDGASSVSDSLKFIVYCLINPTPIDTTLIWMPSSQWQGQFRIVEIKKLRKQFEKQLSNLSREMKHSKYQSLSRRFTTSAQIREAVIEGVRSLITSESLPQHVMKADAFRSTLLDFLLSNEDAGNPRAAAASPRYDAECSAIPTLRFFSPGAGYQTLGE